MLLPNRTKVDDFEEGIKKRWGDTTESILDVCSQMAVAKGHKERRIDGQLTSDQFKELRDIRLRISQSTAEKMVKIGWDDRIKGTEFLRLPPNWATLHQLTKLTDEEFRSALESGAIHSGMSEKNAKELRAPSAPKTKSPKPASQPSDMDAYREIQNILISVAPELDTERRREFFGLIKELVARSETMIEKKLAEMANQEETV